MKKLLNTVFTVVFCLSLILTQIITVSAADSGRCGDNLTWTFDNGILTISGTGDMYDYPAELKMEMVGTPYQYYYYELNTPFYFNVETIIVEEGVTSLGSEAFALLDDFSVYLPSTLTSASYAFYGVADGSGNTRSCNIKSLYAADITSYLSYCGGLGWWETEGTSKPTVYINNEYPTTAVVPNGVTTIPQYAFCGWENLTEVTLPASLRTIEYYAFNACFGLTKINYYGNESNWNNIDIGSYNFEESEPTFEYLEAPTVTITYDANGGTNAPDMLNLSLCDDFTVSTLEPSRDAYIFTGWNTTADGSGTTYTGGETYTVFDNLTLYAQWLPADTSYTISYDANGGTNAPAIQTKAYNETINLSKKIPVKSGYSFRCWNTAADGSGTDYTGGSTYTANENITLYAKWTNRSTTDEWRFTIENGVITDYLYDDNFVYEYDEYGFRTIVSGGYLNRTAYVVIPKTIRGQAVKGIARRAFSFPTGGVSIIVPDTVSYIEDNAFSWGSGNITLTIPGNVSVGKIPYSIYTGCSATVYYGGDYYSWASSGINGDRYGNGWEGLDISYQCTMPNIEYNHYIITYDMNDGSDNRVRQSKFADSVYLDTTIPVREHYTFLGWNTAPDGSGITYTGGDVYSENTDLTLYAQWKALYATYPVIYDANGGTNAPEMQIKKEIEPLTLSTGTPIKEGYTFTGWNTNADGSGTAYTPGDVYADNNPLTLYAIYAINQYTYKFTDDDGSILKEKNVDYGSVITPPENNPSKPATVQYTYTFSGWEGYHEGITQKAEEMIFTATYTANTNQYTYKFADVDGTIIKEVTADYGAEIFPPETPADDDPYTFNYWKNYKDGMTLAGDITFTAVFKYKDYTITAVGLEESLTVTYNSDYTIPPQEKADYSFIGYYTEEGGNGTKLTDEYGNSLKVYNFTESITAYPYFVPFVLNKIEIKGTASADVGTENIRNAVTFATDKEAWYLICTVKFPEMLLLTDIVSKDFKYVTEETRQTENGYTYLTLFCQYSDNDAIPADITVTPFELVFDISKSATPQVIAVEITDDSVLIGTNDYYFDEYINGSLEILPKLAESIVIIGDTEIEKATAFVAEISPDYATSKAVEWSVDDETVATISQDGILTPLKCGTVVITAKATDGSGVYATKTVAVTAYAKINSIISSVGIWDKEFEPDSREYTIYVDKNTNSVSLTSSFDNGGTLLLNGTSLVINNRAKMVTLTDDETVITLVRKGVMDNTDNTYTITVKKLYTTTTLTENGTKFNIMGTNIPDGTMIILTLYKGNCLSDIKYIPSNGQAIQFISEKTYDAAKVMIWKDFETSSPLCVPETVSILQLPK